MVLRAPAHLRMHVLPVCLGEATAEAGRPQCLVSLAQPRRCGGAVRDSQGGIVMARGCGSGVGDRGQPGRESAGVRWS